MEHHRSRIRPSDASRSEVLGPKGARGYVFTELRSVYVPFNWCIVECWARSLGTYMLSYYHSLFSLFCRDLYVLGCGMNIVSISFPSWTVRCGVTTRWRLFQTVPDECNRRYLCDTSDKFPGDIPSLFVRTHRDSYSDPVHRVLIWPRPSLVKFPGTQV